MLLRYALLGNKKCTIKNMLLRYTPSEYCYYIWVKTELHYWLSNDCYYTTACWSIICIILCIIFHNHNAFRLFMLHLEREPYERQTALHTGTFFQNLIKLNRYQIVFTISRLIYNPTDIHLVPIQSENGKFNLNLVDLTWITGRFLCV